MSALLEVRGLEGWYGDSHVLRGVSFDVAEGEAAALVGRNGAGKTTLLKAAMGLLARLKAEGATLLLVEQNLPLALSLADSAMVLGKGELRWRGARADFDAAGAVRDLWLGV